MPDFWEDRLRQALGVDELGADGPRSVADVDPKRWHESVRICRDELGCDFFDWLSAVDEGPADPVSAEDGPAESGSAEDAPAEDGSAENPPGPHRFRIVAHLWSVAERRGVLLRAMLTEGAIASVTDLYPGADWHERETHEMFGVDFPGHPDLKPLLLAPEFEGHPLRKDFVLASRVVKPWPGAKEPGEGRGTVRKRAPKRPPGVPEDWIQPETDAEPEPPATETAPATASQPQTARKPKTEPASETASASGAEAAQETETGTASESAPAPETAPDPAPAPDARTRRPDAP
jgi:NADH-quinone oxidoreductase subunit C